MNKDRTIRNAKSLSGPCWLAVRGCFRPDRLLSFLTYVCLRMAKYCGLYSSTTQRVHEFLTCRKTLARDVGGASGVLWAGASRQHNGGMSVLAITGV